MQQEILDIFKVMVTDTVDNDSLNTDHILNSLILNFKPTSAQVDILKFTYAPINITTLFSREERNNADIMDLLYKQVLHYIEVYGLDQPGLFDLEVTSGQIITMNFVRGVTVSELGDMVRELLYRNAPIKDSDAIKKIIAGYNIDYDINLIANNELRIALFDVSTDTFSNGDDAVRYMCYVATKSTMLIKSDEVIAAVKVAAIPVTFFDNHILVLAQVFNRHKRIIIAAKNKNNRTVINKISRLSKTKHVPILEAINKTFISKALSDDNFDMSVLNKINLRDKFKYLNLLAYKREQLDVDAFIIRNNKMHFKPNRKIWNLDVIDRVEQAVIDSLSADLAPLGNKKILLDKNVHYGLPISRKQAMGNLPYGTSVSVGNGKISAGIYWENAGGATDLDLSTVDTNGNRTGWGSGYGKNPITYSGDVTSAPDGAMEFMTSGPDSEYGLFVNIYNGNTGCEMEIVVGKDNNNTRWISKTLIREKTTLTSRGNLIGFVRGTTYDVYNGRLGNRRVSSNGKNPAVARGMCKFWTVNNLFDRINIDYDIDKVDNTCYDYTLSYNEFSFDKLEDLLLN